MEGSGSGKEMGPEDQEYRIIQRSSFSREEVKIRCGGAKSLGA